MQSKSPRILVYEDYDYKFEVAEHEGVLFLHCESYDWSPSIYKEMLAVFGRFLNEIEKLGYNKLMTITPNPKFAKLFGGTEVGIAELEGKTLKVIEWDLTR